LRASRRGVPAVERPNIRIASFLWLECVYNGALVRSKKPQERVTPMIRGRPIGGVLGNREINIIKFSHAVTSSECTSQNVESDATR
jgi:hypothetical protein